MTLAKQFMAARRASVPLIAIRTADPRATINSLLSLPDLKDIPIVEWDTVRGFRTSDKDSIHIAQQLNGSGDAIIDPVIALKNAEEMPEKAMLFMHQAHRWLWGPGVSQAVWNLRDTFKSATKKRTLVLLCPILDMPEELQQDVLLLDEPLPTEKELAKVVVDIYHSAGLPDPTPKEVSTSTDALVGLAMFPAENACAMSITAKGMNTEMLWERKRSIIDSTRGLKVWRGGETFADVRGCQNAIHYLTGMMTGEMPPRLVVWIDEAEKQFAGSGSDTSGSATKQTASFLTWMENHRACGVMLVGPPGSGKSMLAKSCGASFGRPTIAMDVAAMEDKLVGESKAYTDEALRVVHAMSQGRVLFIATCNKLVTLSPEFRRRFKDATFYVDMPDANELAALWKLYIDRYKISPERAAIPEKSSDWTGAEVRNCCETAWRFRTTLKEAASYIVPVARSARKEIDALREQANGTFISASYPGAYEKDHEMLAVLVGPMARKLEVN